MKTQLRAVETPLYLLMLLYSFFQNSRVFALEILPVSAEPGEKLSIVGQPEKGWSFGLDLGQRNYTGSLARLIGTSFALNGYIGYNIYPWVYGFEFHGGGNGTTPPLPDDYTGYNSTFGIGPFAEFIQGTRRFRGWVRTGASLEGVQHFNNGKGSDSPFVSDGLAVNLKVGGLVRTAGSLWLTLSAGASQNWFRSFAGTADTQGVSFEASAGFVILSLPAEPGDPKQARATESAIEKPTSNRESIQSFLRGLRMHGWVGDGPAEFNANEVTLGNRLSGGGDFNFGSRYRWIAGAHFFILTSGERNYELGPIHRFFSFGPDIGLFLLPDFLYAKLIGGMQFLVSGGNGPNSGAIGVQFYGGFALGARVSLNEHVNIGIEYNYHYTSDVSDRWEGIGRMTEGPMPRLVDGYFPAEHVYSLSLVLGFDMSFSAVKSPD